MLTSEKRMVLKKKHLFSGNGLANANREEKRMSEEAVILHGAPTLAGIKTGSLFRCEYESIEAMRTSLREWNRRFSGKGLRVIPLSFENNKALLYPNHTMWYEHNDFYVIIDEGCDLNGEILYEANLVHKDYGSGVIMLVAMRTKPGKEISLNQFLRKSTTCSKTTKLTTKW